MVRVFRALFGALVVAQIAYSRVPPSQRVAWTRGIVGLMLATSLAESASARGGWRGPRSVLAAGSLGFAAELVGVATGKPFGHYHYGPGLGPQVRGVPVLAAAAWAMMARPAWIVGGLVARTPLLRVLAAAGALTAWDVFLDPRMVREGYWTWPGGGRYEDVPLSNFAGWFATGTAVFAAWSLLDQPSTTLRKGPGPFRRLRNPGRRSDDGALALYVWTWVGELFAAAVLWRTPRVAVAGGLAMGAFAVPAIRARRASA